MAPRKIEDVIYCVLVAVGEVNISFDVRMVS